MRPSQRKTDQLRSITLTRHYTKHAEGSVLVEFGDTKVICTASLTAGVPPFLKDKGQGASISVGIYQGTPILDLDYAEDGSADTDMNVVMTEHGKFIEIQGTAEKDTFEQEELDQLLTLAKAGIQQLVALQKASLW